MATRYLSDETTTSYRLKPSLFSTTQKDGRNRINTLPQGLQHAPLWPGTAHIDLLPDHSKQQQTASSSSSNGITEIVVDFGLLFEGRRKEKEIVLENCTNDTMMVFFNGSSSMFEYENHLTLPAKDKLLFAITLLPSHRHSKNGSATSIEEVSGRIDRYIEITSSLFSNVQRIRLIGHIGFPLILQIPKVLTFPPSMVFSSSSSSDLTHTSGDATNSHDVTLQEAERPDYKYEYEYEKRIPLINTSRYTLVVRISGLEKTGFITVPNCSSHHDTDNRNTDYITSCIQIAPLSVSCLTLRHRPLHVGPDTLSSALTLHISYPFHHVHTLPSIVLKGYGIDTSTAVRPELQLLHQWYHQNIVLRSPRKSILSFTKQQKVAVTEDLKWIAVIDGFVRNKYILKFIGADLQGKFRQHGYGLEDFWVSLKRDDKPIPYGLGVVNSIAVKDTLYDVEILGNDDIAVTAKNIENNLLRKVWVWVPEKEMEEMKETAGTGEETKETETAKDTIEVGESVHVLLPLGTQVLAIPRYYASGILLSINHQSQTMNVKLDVPFDPEKVVPVTTTAAAAPQQHRICRRLPLHWLFLDQNDTSLPTIGSTVQVIYHPPNQQPNITIPWWIQQLRHEDNVLQSKNKSRGTVIKSAATINIVYLTKTGQKLKRNAVLFHSKNTSQNIEIRNGGLEEICVRLTTSAGYQWERDNTGVENTVIEGDRYRDVVLGRGNFIRITLTWLRANQKLSMDSGWCCVTNVHSPKDQSILPLIGTSDTRTFLDLGRPPFTPTNTLTSNKPQNREQQELMVYPLPMTVDFNKTKVKQTSLQYLLVRNALSTEITIDLEIENPNNTTFFLGSDPSQRNTRSNNLTVGAYGYGCYPLHFTPSQRGIYTEKVTLFVSQTSGYSGSDSEQHREEQYSVELRGLCTIPSLTGLPTRQPTQTTMDEGGAGNENDDIQMGQVIEGHTRTYSLNIFNEDVSTATLTTPQGSGSTEQSGLVQKESQYQNQNQTPFNIAPSFTILEAKKSTRMQITYAPIDYGRHLTTLSLYNSGGSGTPQQYNMTCRGVCGTAELHSSATGNVLAFGTSTMKQRKTVHYFLTNVGTLTLRMKEMAIVSPSPNDKNNNGANGSRGGNSGDHHFDIRFVGLVKREQSHQKMTCTKTFWGMLKKGGLRRALRHDQRYKQESSYYWNKEQQLYSSSGGVSGSVGAVEVRDLAVDVFESDANKVEARDADIQNLSVNERIEEWIQEEDEMYDITVVNHHHHHHHQRKMKKKKKKTASPLHFSTDIGDCNKDLCQQMPPLKTDYSYHYQITYVGTNRHPIKHELSFKYEPYQDKDVDEYLQSGLLKDSGGIHSTTDQISLTLMGQKAPSVVISQTFLNFGIVPASSLYYETKMIPVVRKSILMTNHSLITQVMSLISCSSDAVRQVSSRSRLIEGGGGATEELGDAVALEWILLPGQQEEIVFEFCPEEPHVLYHAEIVLENVTDKQDKKNSKRTSMIEDDDADADGGEDGDGDVNTVDDGDYYYVNARGYGGSTEIMYKNNQNVKMTVKKTKKTGQMKYGLCSVGTTTIKEIEIENVGLLQGDYTMEIQSARSGTPSDPSNPSNQTQSTIPFYIRDSVRGVLNGTLDGQSSTTIHIAYDLTQHIDNHHTKQKKSRKNDDEDDGIKDSDEQGADDEDDEFRYEAVLVLKWRPVNEKSGRQVVDDSVLLYGGVGVVNVVPHSLLNKKVVSCLDYGLMLVQQWTKRRLTLTNNGNTATTITLRMHDGHKHDRFMVDIYPPTVGPKKTVLTLQPAESRTIDIKVQPKSVELLKTLLVINIDGQSPLSIPLIGSVAAPHLHVPSLNFDLKIVRVNTTKQIFVDLRNTGNFNVSYTMFLNDENVTEEERKSDFNSEPTSDITTPEIVREGDVLTCGSLSISPCHKTIHPGKKVRMLLRVTPTVVSQQDEIEETTLCLKGNDGSVYLGYVRVCGGGAALSLVTHTGALIGRNHTLGTLLVNHRSSFFERNHILSETQIETQIKTQIKTQIDKEKWIYVRNDGNMPTIYAVHIEMESSYALVDEHDAEGNTERRRQVVNGKVETMDVPRTRSVLNSQQTMTLHVLNNTDHHREENRNDDAVDAECAITTNYRILLPGQVVVLPLVLTLHAMSMNTFMVRIEKVTLTQLTSLLKEQKMKTKQTKQKMKQRNKGMSTIDPSLDPSDYDLEPNPTTIDQRQATIHVIGSRPTLRLSSPSINEFPTTASDKQHHFYHLSDPILIGTTHLEMITILNDSTFNNVNYTLSLVLPKNDSEKKHDEYAKDSPFSIISSSSSMKREEEDDDDDDDDDGDDDGSRRRRKQNGMLMSGEECTVTISFTPTILPTHAATTSGASGASDVSGGETTNTVQCTLHLTWSGREVTHPGIQLTIIATVAEAKLHWIEDVQTTNSNDDELYDLQHIQNQNPSRSIVPLTSAAAAAAAAAAVVVSATTKSQSRMVHFGCHMAKEGEKSRVIVLKNIGTLSPLHCTFSLLSQNQKKGHGFGYTLIKKRKRIVEDGQVVEAVDEDVKKTTLILRKEESREVRLTWTPSFDQTEEKHEVLNQDVLRIHSESVEDILIPLHGVCSTGAKLVMVKPLPRSMVDFGEVATGSRVTRTILLRNVGCMCSYYRLTLTPSKLTSNFNMELLLLSPTELKHKEEMALKEHLNQHLNQNPTLEESSQIVNKKNIESVLIGGHSEMYLYLSIQPEYDCETNGVLSITPLRECMTVERNGLELGLRFNANSNLLHFDLLSPLSFGGLRTKEIKSMVRRVINHCGMNCQYEIQIQSQNMTIEEVPQLSVIPSKGEIESESSMEMKFDMKMMSQLEENLNLNTVYTYKINIINLTMQGRIDSSLIATVCLANPILKVVVLNDNLPEKPLTESKKKAAKELLDAVSSGGGDKSLNLGTVALGQLVCRDVILTNVGTGRMKYTIALQKKNNNNNMTLTRKIMQNNLNKNQQSNLQDLKEESKEDLKNDLKEIELNEHESVCYTLTYAPIDEGEDTCVLLVETDCTSIIHRRWSCAFTGTCVKYMLLEHTLPLSIDLGTFHTQYPKHLLLLFIYLHLSSFCD